MVKKLQTGLKTLCLMSATIISVRSTKKCLIVSERWSQKCTSLDGGLKWRLSGTKSSDHLSCKTLSIITTMQSTLMRCKGIIRKLSKRKYSKEEILRLNRHESRSTQISLNKNLRRQKKLQQNVLIRTLTSFVIFFWLF